ncbi:hypothetical protein ACVBGC_18110 [Burkholderia stagnalis]
MEVMAVEALDDATDRAGALRAAARLLLDQQSVQRFASLGKHRFLLSKVGLLRSARCSRTLRCCLRSSPSARLFPPVHLAAEYGCDARAGTLIGVRR